MDVGVRSQLLSSRSSGPYKHLTAILNKAAVVACFWTHTEPNERPSASATPVFSPPTSHAYLLLDNLTLLVVDINALDGTVQNVSSMNDWSSRLTSKQILAACISETFPCVLSLDSSELVLVFTTGKDVNVANCPAEDLRFASTSTAFPIQRLLMNVSYDCVLAMTDSDWQVYAVRRGPRLELCTYRTSVVPAQLCDGSVCFSRLQPHVVYSLEPVTDTDTDPTGTAPRTGAGDVRYDLLRHSLNLSRNSIALEETISLSVPASVTACQLNSMEDRLVLATSDGLLHMFILITTSPTDSLYYSVPSGCTASISIIRWQPLHAFLLVLSDNSELRLFDPALCPLTLCRFESPLNPSWFVPLLRPATAGAKVTTAALLSPPSVQQSVRASIPHLCVWLPETYSCGEHVVIASKGEWIGVCTFSGNSQTRPSSRMQFADLLRHRCSNGSLNMHNLSVLRCFPQLSASQWLISVSQFMHELLHRFSGPRDVYVSSKALRMLWERAFTVQSVLQTPPSSGPSSPTSANRLTRTLPPAGPTGIQRSQKDGTPIATSMTTPSSHSVRFVFPVEHRVSMRGFALQYLRLLVSHGLLEEAVKLSRQLSLDDSCYQLWMEYPLQPIDQQHLIQLTDCFSIESMNLSVNLSVDRSARFHNRFSMRNDLQKVVPDEHGEELCTGWKRFLQEVTDKCQLVSSLDRRPSFASLSDAGASPLRLHSGSNLPVSPNGREERMVGEACYEWEEDVELEDVTYEQRSEGREPLGMQSGSASPLVNTPRASSPSH